MLRTATLASILAPGLIVAGQLQVPKHLQEAENLLKSLQPESTSYRHKDTSVKWKSQKGVESSESHTDCSGFINALIQHSYPRHNAESFKKWFGTRRPVANTYYETIMAQNGFTRITTISDIQCGDIIAIKYPPGNANTGHIMLISGPPRMRAPSAPIVDGTHQWEVPIIDSSMSGHGKTDTRRNSDGTYRTGLGRGVFRLYGQTSRAVAGYSWSVLKSSEFQDGKTRPIAIGRLDLKFER